MHHEIAPPPQDTYLSQHRAEEALHAWTRAHGFNVSRERVTYGEGSMIVARLYACDRAGKPKNSGKLQESDRTRTLRGSKRIGCPMRIKLCALNKTNPSGE